jgi:hypothetical protein
MNGSSARIAILVTAALAVALAACSKSSDVNALVQACVKTQATQKMCECAAHAAASKLTPELFSAMVYDMQGKKQELDAIAGKMNFDQRASFAQQQFEIMGSCMKDG